MDAIPVIDLRLLSQPEISALALSSSNPTNTNVSFPDESLAPKIDRSTFNESAGSRKQTYSRLRLGPPSSSSPSSSSSLSSPRRRGRPPRSSPLPTPSTSSNDDNHLSILRFLRRLFLLHGLDHALLPLPNPHKRRGRTKKPTPIPPTPPTAGDDANDEDRELLNAKGVAVDLRELGEKGDRAFAEEISRRTGGVGTEEGLLRFLAALEGRWATARKRRRVVDAAGFADALPKGWKLLLALKRKEGRIWVHCRRFLSPSGKQFMTCKEVSSYMLSIVGYEAAVNFTSGRQDENTAMSLKLTNACAADLTEQDHCKMDASMLPSSSCPDGAANTSNTKVTNLPECHKCNLKFSDKIAYDQHWLMFHVSAKRSSLGKSISSGVIVKDGKYECQFCHKVFTERRRYNGHVGVHVRFHSDAPEAVPCVTPAERRPQPPCIEALPLSSSEKQDEQMQSEAVEALPCVNNAESMPEPSSIDDLPLSSSETQDGIARDNIADVMSSNPCQSAGVLEINELKMNAEDCCHSKSNASDSTLDPSSSKHSDIQPNNCDHMAEESGSDAGNFKPMDIEISVDANGVSETKNGLLETVHEMPDNCMADAAASNSGESPDGNIENNRPVTQEKENYRPLENQKNETDNISCSDVQMNTHTDIGSDQNDGKSRKAESTKSIHSDKLVHLWVDHYHSSEEHFCSNASNIVTDANEQSRLPDHGRSLEEEAGDSVLKNSTSKSVDNLANDTIPDCSLEEEAGESVPRDSTSKSLDNLASNMISDHGCSLEEEAGESVPKRSTTKSVVDLTGNMMGEILRNSSEMSNIHVFEDAYDKNFMMPCTGTANETSVDISAIGKVSCFNETSSNFKNAMESADVGFEACSMDCNTINAPETAVTGGNEVSIQDIVKENLDMIAQSPNKVSTKVHASVNSQSPSSLGVVKSSGAAYTEKDPPINAVANENKNYRNDFKFNPDSSITNLSSIWQHSTEDGLFANRAADGLASSICDQQFFLEDNLHSIPGGGPSYNIQTSSNDILASVVEEQGVGTISNYNRPESGLIIGQGLSNENTVVNSFMRSSNRPEPGAKDSLLIPPSSSQNFGITSNASTTSSMFPFHVQDSFMCQTRNSGSVFESSLGCSFGGSDKVPVVDNSGIAGADLPGSAAARPQPRWMQPPSYFSSASAIPDQEKGNKCYYTDQQREGLTGFEGVRLDGYGRAASGLLANQNSQMQSAQQMTFDYGGRDMGNVFGPPIQLDWNMAVPQMNTRQQVTTTCMWCGANFTQQGNNIQMQPDSIGFICPTCKAKISGQLKF